ncbi:nitrate reductase cytochrome c-type subunit [Caenispirillum bisanense]|uniref:nitrate reductase cytochrome c-type subunit n=1 Tax=Caenispirillum bisanense TaxID=414052 RepID=UPI0031D386E2
MRSTIPLLLAVAAVVLAPVVAAQDARGPNPPQRPFAETAPAPEMASPVTDERRQLRAYPEQPPVIPHAIQGYEVNLNTNRCLTCHSRVYTQAVQAPMVSVTHYTDRDGNVLGSVAPRRYFCTQCHVQQTDARPLVSNSFVDIDSLSGGAAGGRQQ